MADIIAFGDKHKKIIKIAVGWFRKKTGAEIEVVHKDLKCCGNPVFGAIDKLINHAADSIDEKWQRRVVREFGELFLWILYKDTAYRDPAFWILYQLLEHADEIKEDLKEYVKEPQDWYVNAWSESKRHTAELIEKGRIPGYAKALDESIFTPQEQERRLRKVKRK